MDTGKIIKQHERCICILEMIKDANQRLRNAGEALYTYQNCKDEFAPIRLMRNENELKGNILHWRMVKERVESYYKNNLNKLQ